MSHGKQVDLPALLTRPPASAGRARAAPQARVVLAQGTALLIKKRGAIHDGVHSCA